jgi:hypothetical protein
LTKISLLSTDLFLSNNDVTAMTNWSEILKLLEAERDRYVLEAADLERRLSFIRQQMDTLENLISGYGLEQRIYQPQRSLPDLSSSATLLLNSPHQVDKDLHSITEQVESKPKSVNPNISDTPKLAESVESKQKSVKPDISDIPKLTFARKPGTLPLVHEYEEYSIQNAILILMRHFPDRHIHVDAIVRDLYGEKLTTGQLMTAKASVSKMLSTGTQTGMWYRVIDAQGVYTLKYEKGITSEQLRNSK